MEIKKEILNKYSLPTLDEYIILFGDSIPALEAYYKEFLKQTDHIPNKIFEAQLLGDSIDDYTEILNYRKQARDEINNLMIKKDEEE